LKIKKYEEEKESLNLEIRNHLLNQNFLNQRFSNHIKDYQELKKEFEIKMK
jgi:hypothetical protein